MGAGAASFPVARAVAIGYVTFAASCAWRKWRTGSRHVFALDLAAVIIRPRSRL